MVLILAYVLVIMSKTSADAKKAAYAVAEKQAQADIMKQERKNQRTDFFTFGGDGHVFGDNGLFGSGGILGTGFKL